MPVEELHPLFGPYPAKCPSDVDAQSLVAPLFNCGIKEGAHLAYGGRTGHNVEDHFFRQFHVRTPYKLLFTTPLRNVTSSKNRQRRNAAWGVTFSVGGRARVKVPCSGAYVFCAAEKILSPLGFSGVLAQYPYLLALSANWLVTSFQASDLSSCL